MENKTTEPVFEKCAIFLKTIGISVHVVPGVTGFLKHVRIVNGNILIDPVSDAVCGSMLHEAGHIAVTPSLFRTAISDDAASAQAGMSAYLESCPNAFGIEEDPIARGIMQSGETEAIAWSYAAAAAIGVDTALPFQLGFDGEGMDLHTMIAVGSYFGINGLAAGGMTRVRRPDAFPKMIRWMQV